MKRTGSKYQPIGERRQIETWKLHRSRPPEHAPEKYYVEFKVYLLCLSHQQKTQFEVVAQDGPRTIRYEGPDIFQLRKQADEFASGVKEIKWKAMLHVSTRGGLEKSRHEDEMNSASIWLKYDLVQVGMRGKEKCYQFVGRDSIVDGLPEVGPDDDNMRALIDDTPDNRAKLESILNGIDLISERIKDLMVPKNILATLGRIDPSRALPFFVQPTNGAGISRTPHTPSSK